MCRSLKRGYVYEAVKVFGKQGLQDSLTRQPAYEWLCSQRNLNSP